VDDLVPTERRRAQEDAALYIIIVLRPSMNF
jgi:hypothetical protein